MQRCNREESVACSLSWSLLPICDTSCVHMHQLATNDMRVREKCMPSASRRSGLVERHWLCLLPPLLLTMPPHIKAFREALSRCLRDARGHAPPPEARLLSMHSTASRHGALCLDEADKRVLSTGLLPRPPHRLARGGYIGKSCFHCPVILDPLPPSLRRHVSQLSASYGACPLCLKVHNSRSHSLTLALTLAGV